jgi:hypothetical protein
MDIRGIRTLNLAGTILFALFSIGIAMFYLPIFIFFPFNEGSDLTMICITILVCWIIFIVYLTYMLYKNTVLAMDEGQFETVKRWTLYGIFFGIFLGGGLIVLLIFLISYASIDEATRPRYYYPPPMYYPPPPAYGTGYQQPATPHQQPNYARSFCPKCRRAVEANWKYCPNCYEKLMER